MAVSFGEDLKKKEELNTDTIFSATQYAAGTLGKAPEMIGCYTYCNRQFYIIIFPDDQEGFDILGVFP